MNNLMVFENKEVEILSLNGMILFNPYHVGRCIDLSDSAVRNYLQTMNEKQAILVTNSDVRDKDIRKLNNAGEKFLTESGLYKLIFKSRKLEAERFTDWVTSEVLPSIRKTGKYEMKPVVSEESKGKAIRILKLNGMEVVSDPDIMRYTGATRWVVRYYSQKVGERGILVDGQELVRLKRDNPTLSKYTNQLLVHCLSGAEKILRAMGVPMRLAPVKIPTKAVNEIPLIPKETVNNWFPKSLRDPVVRDDTRKAFEYAIRKISDKDVPMQLREAYITVANDIYMRTHPYLEHC